MKFECEYEYMWIQTNTKILENGISNKIAERTVLVWGSLNSLFIVGLLLPQQAFFKKDQQDNLCS